MSDPPAADRFNRFPGLLGMRVAEIRPGYCRMEMNVEEKHLRFRANGLHAGAVVSLADSACGAGCQASLEPGKTFSTVELKAIPQEDHLQDGVQQITTHDQPIGKVVGDCSKKAVFTEGVQESPVVDGVYVRRCNDVAQTTRTICALCEIMAFTPKVY